jgi:hypothetical protein
MSEFSHYGHHPSRKDMENCGACALLYAGEEGPNYAAWPLSFLKSGRAIPSKYLGALKKELQRTDNMAYVNNLKAHLKGTSYESLIEEV